ncbi:threonine synthase [Pseudomonas lini]|uniref:Threonine synthase n=1 Tax=Pseudomonas lini TaxID=163011 RepID=A0A0J6HEN5_9PSED|nr:threonine synthase [Pseudomonas lini]KAB0507252.1 threonine synthase [Pseudomonas lini]KMM95466.1 threonine synthase [Pseudomonas lini]SDT37496.1 L-threonine synthase [Pseudomonas lini]
MYYVSTRGGEVRADFRSVVLSGLAEDGGLYVPASLPVFTEEQITSWSWLPFDELVWRVVSPYVGSSMDESTLRALLSDSYRNFNHRAITPLEQIGHNEWILQLFHGPTHSSKDFAAQLQSRLVAHFLGEVGGEALIVGATNGDTGLAALEAFANCPGTRMAIMYPRNGVPAEQLSALQAADPERVQLFPVDGNFDDCQTLVSRLLRDWPLEGVIPVCFNSTNWVGVLAQIVFYFHAALQLGAGTRPVGFSVPAASSAEIYAGYLAQKMGLPINQVIISTNSNDALHQFIHRNRYSTRVSNRTLSPAMDFSLFSNLERFIWELYGHDGGSVKALMEHFEDCGELSIGNQQWLRARVLFDSYAVDESQVRDEVVKLFRETGSAIDPHTAVGVLAGRIHRRSLGAPMVTFGQIAPAKSAVLLSELGVWRGEVPTTPDISAQPPYLAKGDLEGLCQALLLAQQRQV